MRLVLAALVYVLALSSTGRAGNEIESGSSLLNRCHSQAVQSQGACMGFVAGVFDVLVSGPVNDMTACPPAGLTAMQVRNIAIPWIEAHPEDRHFAAARLVATALSEAFPC